MNYEQYLEKEAELQGQIAFYRQSILNHRQEILMDEEQIAQCEDELKKLRRKMALTEYGKEAA